MVSPPSPQHPTPRLTRNDGSRSSHLALAALDVVRHVDQLLRHHRRLALQTAVHHHRVVAQLLRLRRRHVQRLVVVAHQRVHALLEHRAVLLGGLLHRAVDASLNLLADATTQATDALVPLGELVPDAVLVDDLLAVLEGGVVEMRGTGGDGGEIVTHHIGEDQRVAGVGVGSLSEMSALDHGQVLANAVDLVDRGTAGEEDVGRLTNVVQRHVGSGSAQESTASTANEGDDDAVLGLVLQRVEQGHGSSHTVLIGHGMSGLGDADSVEVVSSGMLVLGDHMTGVDAILEEVLRGLGHAHSSLTATHDDNGLGLTTHINRTEHKPTPRALRRWNLYSF